MQPDQYLSELTAAHQINYSEGIFTDFKLSNIAHSLAGVQSKAPMSINDLDNGRIEFDFQSQDVLYTP